MRMRGVVTAWGMTRGRMGRGRMRSGFCCLRRSTWDAQRRDHGCAGREPAQRLRMPFKKSTAP